MPAKRNARSKSPSAKITDGAATAATGAAVPLSEPPKLAFDPSPAAKSKSKARSSSAAVNNDVKEDDVKRLVEEAIARARAARGKSPAGRASTAAGATQAAAAAASADGEGDSAPEVGSTVGGFFSANDRVYSRKTTQCLTDFAGFLLLVFLALYFSISGFWFYQEISKSMLSGAK